MELFCGERLEGARSPVAPIAPWDSAVSSKRVVQKLLYLEDKFAVSQDYFLTVQSEIKPHMRKVLAGWMMEVTEEEHCEESVFLLALNLVDRFLSLVDVKKSQLQLLGCVTLLLASKMRQSRPLTVDRLVYFSDYSISASEIRAWEMVVLNVLEWNAENIIAIDYFASIFDELISPALIPEVRRKACGILALLSIEDAFMYHKQSLLAAACVGAAVKGFHWSRTLVYPEHHSDKFIVALSAIVGLKPEVIVRCLMDIDTLVTVPSSQYAVSAKSSPPKQMSPSGNAFLSQEQSGASPADCITPTNQEVVKFQPETPTDVQDVNF